MASGLMGCGVVTEQYLWQIFRPAMLLLQGQGAKEVVQGPIESFTLAIPLWMVWGGSRFPDAIQVTQLVYERALKTTTLV